MTFLCSVQKSLFVETMTEYKPHCSGSCIQIKFYEQKLQLCSMNYFMLSVKALLSLFLFMLLKYLVAALLTGKIIFVLTTVFSYTISMYYSV